MDLLDQMRDMRSRAAAILPRPGFSDAYSGDTREALVESAGELLKAASDDELLRGYQRTDGVPGDPEAETLIAEIERRKLKL
jgi:hypothetical protein